MQMQLSSRIWPAGLLIALAWLGFGSHDRSSTVAAQESAAKRPGAVDAARLTAADKDGANWMSYGRTYDEKRFSPLKQITDKNVAQLKPAWQFVLNTTRGQEQTPLVVDGVMYVATPYSVVYALDARTGKQLWHYDPEVPKDWSLNGCCGPINRGVAVWNGKVYSGTLNGHLMALDAKTGKLVWDTATFPSDTEYTPTGTPVSQYTTDGEPRVVKGKVMFGTSGGDKGVRGFISAYDAETGKMIWRFYTVPGDPAKQPYENSAMEMAAKTWNGDVGGGGAVWDSISYDPDLDLLYFGTGNATKGPKGDNGDRLFGESIVAVRPDTGEYVWHYQEVPNDAWDYDSIPQLTLADIKIGDRVRKVVLHAPKNGFFYVLDRATGELLSAAPLFKSINWATSIDLKTGRPIENPAARNRIQADGKLFGALPGTIGGHNWQAMSYSPLTGLTYVTMLEGPAERTLTPDIEKEMAANSTGDEPGWKHDDEVIAKEMPHYHGHMAAWDPVMQHEVWGVDDKGIWLGGTLSTAGNLVLMGTAEGELLAYQADTGKELWSKQVQTAIIAPPITYEVGGEQYVAVTVGWGASYGLTQGPMGAYNHIPNNLPRVVAFKLNGKYTFPPVPVPVKPTLNPPPDTASAEQIASGRTAYTARCTRCHGSWALSPGDVPDLRYSASVYSPELLRAVVRDGAFRGRGMPMFGPEVTDQMLADIRAYIIHQANEQVAKNKAQQH